MNIDTKKILYVIAGLFAVFAALYTFSIFAGFLGIIGADNLFTENHPLSIIAIIGTLLFTGIFIFNAAGKILSGAMR